MIWVCWPAGDVLIAASYSGETREILAAAPPRATPRRPARRAHRCTRVVPRRGRRTSRSTSACPRRRVRSGLAPTASTAATMALGDALAVALFEERGFTADDFALLHPGGALGRRLLRVEDLMRGGDDLPCVLDDASLADSVAEISNKRLGVTTVVDAAGDLIGVITDGDLRRGLQRAADIRTLMARDLMTSTSQDHRPLRARGPGRGRHGTLSHHIADRARGRHAAARRGDSPARRAARGRRLISPTQDCVLGRRGTASMNRIVARANAMPRPAKLARQTRQARRSPGEGDSWPLELYGLRACRDCRAGFAGRDMQVVRAAERFTLASGAAPGRSLGAVH